MPTLRQMIDYVRWWNEELQGTKSTQTIYDDLSAAGKYEPTIDYPARVKRFAHIFKQLPLQPKTVLDLACGTGAMIDAMPWKKTANITGLDISTGMLAVARKRFATDKNIGLKEQSFLDLPFAGNSFDLVTITYATRFVPKDKEMAFIRNVARVLAPGGYLVAVTAEDRFSPINRFVSDHTGLPRGCNLRMNYSDYVTQLVAPILPLKKRLTLEHEIFFFRHVALVFQKPRRSLSLIHRDIIET